MVNDDDSQIKKKKTSRKGGLGIQSQRQFLKYHIKLCLRNHMNYIICGDLDEVELCHIFGIMVVEMKVSRHKEMIVC